MYIYLQNEALDTVIACITCFMFKPLFNEVTTVTDDVHIAINYHRCCFEQETSERNDLRVIIDNYLKIILP